MNKITTALAALAATALMSCNDSFLDKQSRTGLTEDNALINYENFKAFAYPCYAVFENTEIGTSLASWAQNGPYRGDIFAGYLNYRSNSWQNPFAFQTVASTASGNGWSFGSAIRRANMMLAHIDQAQMTQKEKDHWRAVAYFFHAYRYMELIDRFGDVPWVTIVLKDGDQDKMGPRMPRKEVADSVLQRLKWAEEHLGPRDKREDSNDLTVDCILATISRFALREGTWRKYHEMGDYEPYLRECARASELLIPKYPKLYQGTDGQPAAGYGELWTSPSLANVPGVIFYKQYEPQINAHGATYIERTSSHMVETNAYTVSLFLMKNGLPVANAASAFHKDSSMYAEFRDRDPRLYHNVMPPYKVAPGKGNGPYGSWHYTTNPADREYIDIMKPNETCSNPGVGMKRLPNQNWSASLVPEVPRLGTGAFVTSRSGYYIWKNTCNWEANSNNTSLNVADKPIFKIEEVLLNEAEAKFELGEFTQDVADSTINRLRDRAGVAKMTVAAIDENFDPERPSYYPKGNDAGIKVPPVLWEIRRERIVELLGEGFGFYDVRRWRMAPWFLNRPTLGVWATKKQANANKLTLYNPETGLSDGNTGTLQFGRILTFNDPLKEGKGWLEKYYLYQAPTTQLILNGKLKQNEGW